MNITKPGFNVIGSYILKVKCCECFTKYDIIDENELKILYNTEYLKTIVGYRYQFTGTVNYFVFCPSCSKINIILKKIPKVVTDRIHNDEKCLCCRSEQTDNCINREKRYIKIDCLTCQKAKIISIYNLVKTINPDFFKCDSSCRYNILCDECDIYYNIINVPDMITKNIKNNFMVKEDHNRVCNSCIIL